MNPIKVVTGVFRPQPTLSEEQVNRGLRMMTAEGIASMAMFSVTSSGILAAFALALGANNLQIGILASLPFITQPIQIPAILLVERLRWRKAIALASWVPAQLMWILIAMIPLFIVAPSGYAIAMLLVFMGIRGMFGAVTNCAWNGWVRDLVPQQILGSYFSRRMALATTGSIIFGLAGAFFVDYWQGHVAAENEILGYTLVLLVGAVFLGLASPVFMSQMPEPLMPPTSGPQPSLRETLATPLRDQNFRHLLNFLLFWGFASNLAIPFFTIYMLERLGFPLPVVIALNTLAQITNVLFVRIWGPFADKLGSKVVLSTCVSLYLLVILGWVFTTQPDVYFLTIPLVIVLQFFAGIAAGGVALTVGTIGLKLAPQGRATSYMAVASLATNLGAGLGPLVGGFFADFFSLRVLRITFEWISPHVMLSFPAFDLTGFDFLFMIAFIIGLITLNTLTTIEEEGEVGREVLMTELLAPTRQMTHGMGTDTGPRITGEYPYAYLRRVPGLDVAFGVTAHLVASTAKRAVVDPGRRRAGAREVAQRVNDAVTDIVQTADAAQLEEAGLDLALYSAKGAMNAMDESDQEVGELARGTMVGLLTAMEDSPTDNLATIRAAARGMVQGASEAGADILQAAAQAVEGAREVAQRLGITAEDAATQAALGALQAAEAIGPEAAAEIRKVLPANFEESR